MPCIPRFAAAAVAALILVACSGDKAEPIPEEAPEGNSIIRRPSLEGRSNVQVFFHQGDTLMPVIRNVGNTDPMLHAALEALLLGPSDDERQKGVASPFSRATYGRLRSVIIESGTAVIDFGNLAAAAPNASSSAGSEQLLEQLNATVFQYPEVQSAVYRMEGSCETFYNWLQRGCVTVERSSVVPVRSAP